MNPGEFFIADVFAERRYSGNQLAVVMAEAGMTAERMQAIAREMNFSETTFILSRDPSPKGYRVRIFTPFEEVPFAGHPTLGTACVIRDYVMDEPSDTIVLELDAGQVPVVAESTPEEGEEGGVFFMTQPPPVFGAKASHREAARVLGLDEDELDHALPVQAVSTGLPFCLVPVRTLASMKRIRLDTARYHEFIENSEAKGVMAFAPETYEAQNSFNLRMFAPNFGIAEDPATGSAAGCLAAYLTKHRVLGDGAIDIQVEQGYEIGRPSLLRLRTSETDSGITVEVGGRVIPVARGVLL